MSSGFLLTALIVCLVPGIGVIHTLSSTLRGGASAGFWAALGCTIATVVHMTVASAGLASVLYGSAELFRAIQFAGVGYLSWMAWAVLGERGGLNVQAGPAASPARLVWRGIVLNILNPKLPLFFVAFLPQFLPAGGGLRDLFELGSSFSLMTFVVFMGYVVIAATGRRKLLASQRAMTWLRRAFAASFLMLGLKLAVERAR